ncbi:MAG: Fic family protein [Treponema sp.]|nr:Fic family protein [Treponema sp.]
MVKNTWEHITFAEKWTLSEKAVNLLGQCFAYVNAMLKVPIRPDYRDKMHTVSLNKGALATTAIEGNTLTEDDLALIQSGKDLEPSRRYLQKEVENVLAAFNTIFGELVHDKTPLPVSPELIKRFHEMIGRDIGEAFGANPGQFRRQNVIVGIVYRPPVFGQVDELVRKLCDWLSKAFHYSHGQNFDEAVIQAIVTHVYIVWIHPFMDGNGRTARLLEFYLMLRAGIPSFASHILSNHYNETRTMYYMQLEESTKTGDLSAFIQYALEGFRDGLEQTLKVIHEEQMELTWNNYVHDMIEKIEGKNRNSLRRLRYLAYQIPSDRLCSPDEISILTAGIAEEYRKLNPVTLRRDLDLLAEKGLLKAEKGKYRANHALLHSYMSELSVSLKRHY